MSFPPPNIFDFNIKLIKIAIKKTMIYLLFCPWQFPQKFAMVDIKTTIKR